MNYISALLDLIDPSYKELRGISDLTGTTRQMGEPHSLSLLLVWGV